MAFSNSHAVAHDVNGFWNAANEVVIIRSKICGPDHHFDASRVLTPIVTFVAETLVPLMVVAPKEKVGLPPETAAGLLSGASLVELLDGSLLQPTITMVADMTPMMTAFFIKRNAP